jgi:hypothetical protein
MAASLSQYTTTYLMNALYTNPTAQTFPWENGFTRAQILTELANRSGQNDVSQIVSASSKSVTNKSQIR